MGALQHRLEHIERRELMTRRQGPRQGSARLVEPDQGPALGLGKRAELLAVGEALMLGGGDGVAGAAKLVASLAHFQAERLGRLNGGVSVAGERCRLGLGVLQSSPRRVPPQPSRLRACFARRGGRPPPKPCRQRRCSRPSARDRLRVDTSLWPGLSLACKALPCVRSTTPIWASRRLSAGGAGDELAQRHGAFGQLRIGLACGRAANAREPPRRQRHRDRRRGSRQAPARSLTRCGYRRRSASRRQPHRA